jgi:LacI family transcriptional regulator
MSVTIKQIAKRTGLSIPTVGNVLGRSASRYSAETRRRVLQAAQEMGYRPNSSARAMRSGRIGCAALVLSRSRQLSHSHIPIGLLDGIDDALAQHNMHLTVSRLTDEQLSRDDFLPKVLREYMADGMIVNYTHEIPPAMLELIRAHHTPAVWLNAKLDSDCVYPDDFSAAETATAQLIGMGHRHIALLHLIAQQPWGSSISFAQALRRFHYSVGDRAGGYVCAMRAAALSPLIVSHERFIPEADHPATCRALLSGPDRPTAVLVYSDRDLSLLMAAASELGLNIPRDLSVLVFYPTEPWMAGKYVSPVAIPTAEIGRRAVHMLLRKILLPDEPCPAEPVHYGALMRDTVAPAPPRQI